MNVLTKISFHFYPSLSFRLTLRQICVIRGLQTTYVLRKHPIRHFTSVKESLQIAPFMQNKPNLHFTTGSAGHTESKDICVSNCPIKKYALYPFSPRSLRTQRLIKNKPNSKPNKANFPAPGDKTNPIQTQYRPKQTQSQGLASPSERREEKNPSPHPLINRMEPKLLNRNPKNSLTVRSNPLKYLLSCGKCEIIYEDLHG